MSWDKVSAEVQKNVHLVLKNDSLGPSGKWVAIETILVKHGLAYRATVEPEYVLAHPLNRGGTGINAHNCHAVGAKILQVGGDMAQLHKATCFEMPPDKTDRDGCLKFNSDLAENSLNMLAPVNGRERYLSVSCSHTVAFCRAVLAACSTSEDAIQDQNTKKISMQLMQRDNVLMDMVKIGWQWLIINWQVEKVWPDLPSLIESALNASNNVAQSQSEIESMHMIATAITKYTKASEEIDWKNIHSTACASRPPHVEYMDVLMGYVRMYGGGPEGPMIKFLASVAQEHNRTHRRVDVLMFTSSCTEPI